MPTTTARAAKITARRLANPEREARRQQELRRMSNRYDYIPTYRDITDGRGVVLQATYLGHIRVPVR